MFKRKTQNDLEVLQGWEGGVYWATAAVTWEGSGVGAQYYGASENKSRSLARIVAPGRTRVTHSSQPGSLVGLGGGALAHSPSFLPPTLATMRTQHSPLDPSSSWRGSGGCRGIDGWPGRSLEAALDAILAYSCSRLGLWHLAPVSGRQRPRRSPN